MNRQDFTALGNRMKRLERISDDRIMQGVPVICRLDGKSFHTFTKGLRKPFDDRLSECMMLSTKHLVEKTHATIGYTQSDEITIVFANTGSDMPFDGRIQKMSSLFAAITTAFFNSTLTEHLPEKQGKMPVFDARTFAVPNLSTAVENILWREADATRNSLSMAAQAFYSHKELDKVGTAGKHELLHKKGINWNDYPDFFKRGTYVRREAVLKNLTDEELSKIPENRRPVRPIIRHVVKPIDNMPPLSKITNKEGVLFFGETPITT